MPASSKRLVDYMLHLLSVALTAIMKPTRIIFLGCIYLPPTEASSCDSCKLHQRNFIGLSGNSALHLKTLPPSKLQIPASSKLRTATLKPEQDPPIKPLSSPKPQSRSRASEGF